MVSLYLWLAENSSLCAMHDGSATKSVGGRRGIENGGGGEGAKTLRISPCESFVGRVAQRVVREVGVQRMCDVLLLPEVGEIVGGSRGVELMVYKEL